MAPGRGWKFLLFTLVYAMVLVSTRAQYIVRAPTAIGGTCQSDEECSGILNAKCGNTQTCECVQDSTANKEKTKCIPEKINMECAVKDDCSKIPLTDCTAGKCTCASDHTPSTDLTMCKTNTIGGSCQSDEECSNIINAECRYNICECDSSSTPDTANNRCIPEYVGGDCRWSDECNNIRYSECRNGRCECWANYYPDVSKKHCSAEILGMGCVEDEECSRIPHALCNNGVCDCDRNYTSADNGSLCIPVGPSICQSNLDCGNNITHMCNLSTGFCSCQRGYEEIGEKCLAPLHKPCSLEEGCIDPNAICTDFQCNCQSGFVTGDDGCTSHHGTHIHLKAQGNGEIIVDLDIEEN